MDRLPNGLTTEQHFRLVQLDNEFYAATGMGGFYDYASSLIFQVELSDAYKEITRPDHLPKPKRSQRKSKEYLSKKLRRVI